MTHPIKQLSKCFRRAPLAAALAFSGAASATPVASLFVNGANRMSDDSGEIAVRYNGTSYVEVTGALAAGDYLVAGTNFGSTWTPPTGQPGQGGVDELTGISVLKIQSISAYTTITPCGGASGLSAGECGALTMQAPTAATFNAILNQFGIASISELDDNSVAAILDDPSLDYTRTSGSAATNLQSAANGTLYFVTGLVGADTWTANAPLSIADFTGPFGQPKGNYSASLTVTYQNIPGVTLDPSAFLSDGSVSVPTSTGTGYGVFDQSALTVTATIPEPATLSLMGLGLLGIGTARMRRRARS